MDKKPQLGDLIEIFRGTYQHWGIYVGDGYIIHLAPPSEYAQAGAYSTMSVLCDMALVKRELLKVVAGDDDYVINNLLDDKYKPRPVHDILQEAKSLVGKKLKYSEYAQAGAYSTMSVLCDMALVKRELLKVVAGDDDYVINNLLDDKYKPRPVHDILQEAKSLVGKKLKYCVFRVNCEHFVTNLRYRKAESRQVKKAGDLAIGVGVATLGVFIVGAFISSLVKEKRNQ
ncbi:hypothetical protein C0J50_7563 [Silurus asotus]|uniref:LRAT domain-containing protein n=1 Tax=Silurus asotus TaxID=30991 RepID=A0AAD5F8C5_SILAS|nr:hypothetical protein C0J50_7563 [Silurus asotus]